MNHSQLQWHPEPHLIEQLTQIAQQRGQTTESIITEAVLLYLQTQSMDHPEGDEDPLVGLFSGSSDLSTQSEDILQQSITAPSGWTWKQEPS